MGSKPSSSWNQLRERSMSDTPMAAVMWPA
jgi:hypothetical protein